MATSIDTIIANPPMGDGSDQHAPSVYFTPNEVADFVAEEAAKATGGENVTPFAAFAALGYELKHDAPGCCEWVKASELSSCNRYYYRSIRVLAVAEIEAGESCVATFYDNDKSLFTMTLNCGYCRARAVAMSAVIRWHRFSGKCKAGREGVAE